MGRVIAKYTFPTTFGTISSFLLRPKAAPGPRCSLWQKYFTPPGGWSLEGNRLFVEGSEWSVERQKRRFWPAKRRFD